MERLLASFTLNNILLYIAAGYVFYSVFCFVNETAHVRITLQSVGVDLIFGFVLKNIGAIVPYRTKSPAIDVCLFLGGCAILGYLLGLLYQQVFVRRVLHFLRIRNTLQKNVWHSITLNEKTLWACIGYKQADLKYYGILRFYDDDQQYPLVALYGYSKGTYNQDVKNPHSSCLERHTGNLGEFVLLDTSKADYIEFVSTKSKQSTSNKTQKEETSSAKQ